MTTAATRRVFYLLPGLVILAALLASSAQRFAVMRNDLLQFYVSSQLLGTPGYYDASANHALADKLAPEARVAGFPCRPPFQTMLLWPLLRWLPLRTAFLAFQLLSAACLVWFTLWFAARSPTLPVLTSLSVPVAICLINGQDTFLVLLIAGGSVLLTERQRPFAAGLLLALCAIKFHIFLLLPAMLLLQRRWKTAAGFASGAATLLFLSFLVQGWRWPLELLAVIRKPELNPFLELMPNLHGLYYRLGIDTPALEVLSSLGVAALVLTAARGASFQHGLSAVVLGGLLTSYHAYLYDPSLLLLPLALLPANKLWTALTAPPLYVLAVLDGPAGTAGIGGLVLLMAASLATLAFPRLHRLLEFRSASRAAAPKPC